MGGVRNGNQPREVGYEWFTNWREVPPSPPPPPKMNYNGFVLTALVLSVLSPFFCELCKVIHLVLCYDINFQCNLREDHEGQVLLENRSHSHQLVPVQETAMIKYTDNFFLNQMNIAI